jgi:hypothetical protein
VNIVPKVFWPTRNTKQMTLRIGGVVLWYSYNTLIAVAANGGVFRTNRRYSNTTARHLREIYDGFHGVQEVEQEELERLATEGLVTHFQDELRERFL